MRIAFNLNVRDNSGVGHLGRPALAEMVARHFHFRRFSLSK